jgi:RsiG-like
MATQRCSPHYSQMIEVRPGGRRRIDRVLAPGFLDGISERTLGDVRSLRDDAAQEETDLSYLRRLLHARIDIVRAEQRRRDEGGSAVVEDLATILADPARPAPAGSGRLQRLQPSRAEAHRRYVEALVADVDLSDVTALTGEKLAEALAAYLREEQSVSMRRRQVQAVVDALNAEIAARYRAGTASVDDLLARELLNRPNPKPR